MESDLENAIENLKLMKEEEAVLEFDEEVDDEKAEQIALSLIGRLYTTNSFDVGAMKSTELTGFKKYSDIVFNTARFWIKVYDVTGLKQAKVFAKCIPNSMGKFVGIDEDNMVGMDRSLNFMANIDITKPLRRGIRVKVCGAPVWFDIKYVRLSEFCYACGMLGHIYKVCELYDDSVLETSLPYGPKSRAFPIKNNRRGRETEKQEEKQLLQAFRKSRKTKKIKTKLIFNNPLAINTTSMESWKEEEEVREYVGP
ncbi:hypothetical protein Cgig2_008773 [Carnegiea gigantea]|uniref:CCHC-type domain-containing protein n=1 Tax=Carnegiea gigantea TaxID=171969 RepID=A0A9Q1JR07_9CARY|nr:hypothetical protein Cgig2_008773 [Carnegiea gigantea]